MQPPSERGKIKCCNKSKCSHQIFAFSSSGIPESSNSTRKGSSSRVKRRNDAAVRSSSRFLKPGALAKIRDARMNARASSSSSGCTAIGRKRVLVLDELAGRESRELKSDELSPQRKVLVAPVKDPPTPGTPKCLSDFSPLVARAESQQENRESESPLESLPFDLLVRILCLLHHDQLKLAFHVSQKIRKAALVARQCYFNYTTPDRSRQEMLQLTTPRPEEHWPFVDRGFANGEYRPLPITPKAPRHDQRPPARLSHAEMKQISARLFQGPSSRFHRRKPPGLPRAGAARQLTSHRVLFYEDELCQAVAQNRLR